MTTNGTKVIGQAIDRVDGILKVTGTANYATDWPIKNVAHAYLLKSSVASATISDIDTSAAEKQAGVISVITYKNAPKVAPSGSNRGGPVLQEPKVDFYGQHIGVVVAETYEQARAAARLIKVKYQETPRKVDFEKNIGEATTPRSRPDAVRGDFDAAFKSAAKTVDAVYETPIEHHQPMEPHSTIAVWQDDKLTVYNPSQVVVGMQGALVTAFGLKPEMVRVISPHIGGGFGSKGGAWPNTILAAMAAKVVNRPVKLALTRQDMFNSVGLRQRNRQKIRLAATAEGKVTGIEHITTTHVATTGEFVETCGDLSNHLYDAANARIAYRALPMNLILPTFTRAPGKTPGSFALESAIDELAHELKIDPVDFRLMNIGMKDPSNGRPFSSRATEAALKRGRELFGWNKRKAPGQNRTGEWLVGYGVGIGSYPARQQPSTSNVKLTRSGGEVSAVIELAAADLGTGTHTILAQVASETLDLPLEKIEVRIGDSSFPPAAGSVGSLGAISYCNAVSEVCTQCRTELQAKTDRKYFAPPSIAELMEAAGLTEYQTQATARAGTEAQQYSSHSFNVNFAEVAVHELTGRVRVPRILALVGAGRIMNAKTARSQVIGGCVWGIGQALTEEAVLDPRYGNFVTRTFAEYHIPVNLDVGDIDVVFMPEEDKVVNKLGIKGLGEVGIVGVAGAIANAVFNATGKRVRELPITPDKLL